MLIWSVKPKCISVAWSITDRGAKLGFHTDINFYGVNEFNLKLGESKANNFLYIPFSSLHFFSYQGEQLCRILQLQIFSSLLGLLSTVLPFHCCNRFTVFYQVLDSKYSNLCTVSACSYYSRRNTRFEVLRCNLVSPKTKFR